MKPNFLTPYLACCATGLFSFYDLCQFSLFNIISTSLLNFFHLATTQLGFLSAAFLFANALWLIPAGILLDRYPAKIIGISFLTLASIACFVMAHASSIFTFALMRFIQGLASATSLLISTRLAIFWFPRHKALATGLMITFALSGGMFGNAVFAQIVSYLGWREALVMDSVMGIAIVLFMFCFLPKNSGTPSTITNKNLSAISLLLKSSKKIIKDKNVIAIGFYIGLMNLPIFILGSLWGNFYLTRVQHLHSNEASLLSALLFLGVMIGSPIMGSISDKASGRQLPMSIGALAALLIMCLMILNQSANFILLKTLFILLGVFSSAQIIGYAEIADRYGLNARSTATGVATLIENGIGACAQPLFGWLLTLTWQNTITARIAPFFNSRFSVALLLFPVAFISCLAISLWIKKDCMKIEP